MAPLYLGLVGTALFDFGFLEVSWRCPGNEGFHMWSPIEVGVVDVIDIIRRCV